MDWWRGWHWCMCLGQEDIWLSQIWSHQLGSENIFKESWFLDATISLDMIFVQIFTLQVLGAIILQIQSINRDNSKFATKVHKWVSSADPPIPKVNNVHLFAPSPLTDSFVYFLSPFLEPIKIELTFRETLLQWFIWVKIMHYWMSGTDGVFSCLTWQLQHEGPRLMLGRQEVKVACTCQPK